MLQDFDLGALGIAPQHFIQPFQFGHDPRGVHARRRGDRAQPLDWRFGDGLDSAAVLSSPVGSHVRRDGEQTVAVGAQRKGGRYGYRNHAR